MDFFSTCKLLNYHASRLCHTAEVCTQVYILELVSTYQSI